LDANGNNDIPQLQVVHNTLLGQLWEDRGEIESEDTLLARREDYGTRPDGSDVELPEGVLVLTCGVDTQDDRLEYEVVGHGHFGETWGIEKGIIMGRPDDTDVWARLDAVIEKVYRFESGAGLRVSMTFCDEGGHFTQDVRQQCRARVGKKVFAIAGSNRHDAPYTSPPRKQKIVVRKTMVGSCWRYDIGVDAGKQIIMDNLRVQTPGSRYCHFPKRDDYGAAYFAGLLSERLVYKQGKKQPWRWEKIPGHERNEALDCRNYALAAFKALPKDLDAIANKLRAARGETAAEPVATAVKPAPKPTRSAPRRSGGLDRHYDDW
jgi:phage terminase large subunit GpA-like protein